MKGLEAGEQARGSRSRACVFEFSKSFIIHIHRAFVAQCPPRRRRPSPHVLLIIIFLTLGRASAACALGGGLFTRGRRTLGGSLGGSLGAEGEQIGGAGDPDRDLHVVAEMEERGERGVGEKRHREHPRDGVSEDELVRRDAGVGQREPLFPDARLPIAKLHRRRDPARDEERTDDGERERTRGGGRRLLQRRAARGEEHRRDERERGRLWVRDAQEFQTDEDLDEVDVERERGRANHRSRVSARRV
jgi:hypothetical protein